MISCEAKAMPKRMAAQPHALEKVLQYNQIRIFVQFIQKRRRL